MRIDRVTTPPGMIASAKTWTLKRTDGGFWMIHLGKAVRDVPMNQGVASKLARHAADGMADSNDDRLSEAESVLDTDDLPALAADERATFVSWDLVTGVRIKQSASQRDGQYPIAHVKGARKLKLEFTRSDESAVREFFAPVAQLVS